MALPVQTLIPAIAVSIKQILGAADKPARLPVQAQASKAALAIRHVQSLLDATTDESMREVVAMALACLQYSEAANLAAVQREKRAA